MDFRKKGLFIKFYIVLFSSIFQFYRILSEQARSCSRQIVTFGIFGAIAYPLFGFLNVYVLTVKHYENFSLRLIAGGLCLLLAIKNYWPKSLRWYLPIHWYLTLLYGLPFFFIFMLLKNGVSSAWLLNVLTVVFFVILVVDWLSAIILFILGALISVIVYHLTTPAPLVLSKLPIGPSDFVGAFAVTFLLGILFSRNKTLTEKEKLSSMRSLGASIAHELRTPLHSISHALSGVKRYLPPLIQGYKFAKSQDRDLSYIGPKHIKQLEHALDSINSEVKSSFTVIDMLLMKLNPAAVNSYPLDYFSVKNTVANAIARYPLGKGQEALVNVTNNADFIFWGSELLLIHVIFNLLKNALFSIQEARKGVVSIWLVEGEYYNELHFKDTGKGMSKKTRSNIFDRFYSETHHGTGVGLAFCQWVLHSFRGDISCDSDLGEYTEFILFFPKVMDK